MRSSKASSDSSEVSERLASSRFRSPAWPVDAVSTIGILARKLRPPREHGNRGSPRRGRGKPVSALGAHADGRSVPAGDDHGGRMCGTLPREEDAMSPTTEPATTGAPVDVILRDGGTLRLRAPDTGDAEGLVEFFARLSDRSLYLRFHGMQPVDRRLVEPYLDPDWAERGALVGTLARERGPERIVALASYTRLRDPSAAEVAFAVADEEHGRGIATRLLEQLAARAGETGISRFVADVLEIGRAHV